MDAVTDLHLLMDYPEPDTYRVQLCVEGVYGTPQRTTLEPVAVIAVAGSMSGARLHAVAVLDALARKAMQLEPPEP